MGVTRDLELFLYYLVLVHYLRDEEKGQRKGRQDGRDDLVREGYHRNTHDRGVDPIRLLRGENT